MNAPSQDIQVESLKVPPHSIEAEQSVLGGLLLDNSAWDRLADFLQESAFYRYDHRLLFQHIGKLIAQGREVRQLLDEAESKVFAIAEEGAHSSQGFVEIKPLLTQVVERIDTLYH